MIDFQYVPLLAKEGVKHKAGGDDAPLKKYVFNPICKNPMKAAQNCSAG
jgi:hypothetical protein